MTKNTTYAWIALLLAGVSEVVWAYFMKQSEGFTHLVPSVLFILVMLFSMSMLTYSVKYIQISLAYPIWVAIGAIGAVLAGVFFFGEVISLSKIIFLAMIVGGVVGLKAFH